MSEPKDTQKAAQPAKRPQRSLKERNIRLISIRDGKLKTTVSMDATLYAILLMIFDDDPTDLAVWVREQVFSRACRKATSSGARSRSRFVQSAALELIRERLEQQERRGVTPAAPTMDSR